MPIWFLVFIAVCACFALSAAVRGIWGSGIYVAGQRMSRFTVLLAMVIILIAWGLFAAIQLGFISNHAP